MSADDGDDLTLEDDVQDSETNHAIDNFWEKVMDDVRKVTVDDFKQQVLPLARIKRIMKLDEEVKMISAEAPLLFAKAAEIFILELTLRSWIHTEENKRRTLQKNDIGSAASQSDQYDFLIDILPTDELKHSKPKEEPPARNPVSSDQIQYYLQLAQQHQAALQQPQITTQIQSQANQNIPASQIVQVAGSTNQQPPQQPIQLVQQVVTPNGELQQIPLQLTPSQINMIRMQMQNGSNQPILIQTGINGQAQIIQVGAQQQQPQPLYITPITAVQEGEIIS